MSPDPKGASYPALRMRRLRASEPMRRLVRETRLQPGQLVQPLFLVPGHGVREEIPSLPGIHHLSPDQAAIEAGRLAALGVGGVILFGVPEAKDAQGSQAWDPAGTVQQGLEAIRSRDLSLVLMTDVCLCQYTDHGHCGVLSAGEVDNDASLELLARVAVSHAEAGADVVAPSDMMDGRVAAIRKALEQAGHTRTAILAYSAKYASAFYGPFRDAVDSAPHEGDRRGYQMDPANGREALREMELDLAEGADALMVKPALPYLDILARARERFDVPLAAYCVSGEYAMLTAAAQRGLLDERRAVLEALTSISRAGADIIISYHSAQAATWLAG